MSHKELIWVQCLTHTHFLKSDINRLVHRVLCIVTSHLTGHAVKESSFAKPFFLCARALFLSGLKGIFVYIRSIRVYIYRSIPLKVLDSRQIRAFGIHSAVTTSVRGYIVCCIFRSVDRHAEPYGIPKPLD